MTAQYPLRPNVPEELRALFRAEELEHIGVVDLTPASEEEREYRAWLANGYHGSMSFMERHASLKFRPDTILTGARSAIFVALSYYQQETDSEPDVPTGRIARYAWGRDYHKELGKRLKRVAHALERRYPGERFRAFTDATPLAERYYAERAGIGFTGRNTLLINSEFGSWFFLGEILSTRRFDAGGPAEFQHGACPHSCRRCIDACPTGALLAPYRIDASRCISYLTIEHPGSIPYEYREAIGAWLFGCDRCQEVCPLNGRVKPTQVERFLKPIAGGRVLLEEILHITDDDAFVKRFAGSPLMRAGRRRMVRNALVVAANINARTLLPIIETLVTSSDPLIAEHARWALDHMR